MSDFLSTLYHSVIAVVALFILARTMGKKQIAQLSFIDYTIGISIGSVAGRLATDKEMSLTIGITALIVFAIFAIGLSFLSLKSINIRKLIEGTPIILIQKGRFIKKNLKRVNMNINDVMEECRFKGAFSVADIEYAIIENSGRVSILLKPGKQNVTVEDMNLQKVYKGLSVDLIIDGKILRDHLRMLDKTEQWLFDELRKHNVKSISDVLLATIDGSGAFFVDTNENPPKPLKI